MTMQVDLLLECSDIVTVPIESVLELPHIGDQIVCVLCKGRRSVKKVGRPYAVEHRTAKPENNQRNIMEKK